MSLVLSLCATTVPLNCIYHQTIFIYRPSHLLISHHSTRLYKHTNNFFLESLIHHSIYIYCIKPACTSPNQTPTQYVCWAWLPVDALGSLWSLWWATLRLMADMSCKVPPSCESEVSIDVKATCHFGSSVVFVFGSAEPSSPVQDHRG